MEGNKLEYFAQEGTIKYFEQSLNKNVIGGAKKGDFIITPDTTIQEASFTSYPGAFVLRDASNKSELYLYAGSESEKRAWLRVIENTITELRTPSRSLSTKAPAVKVAERQPDHAVAPQADSTSAPIEDPPPTSVEDTPATAEASPIPIDPVATCDTHTHKCDEEEATASADVSELVLSADEVSVETSPVEPSKLDQQAASAPSSAAADCPPVEAIGLKQQESLDSVGAEEEVEVGTSVAPAEELTSETDEELDAAMFATVGAGGN